jgi:hypothetical protein
MRSSSAACSALCCSSSWRFCSAWSHALSTLQSIVDRSLVRTGELAQAATEKRLA